MKLRTVKRAVGGLFALSAVAMVVAAATSESDKGVRGDGSRVPPGSDEQVDGDPRGGAAQHGEGDAKRPDSTTDEAKSAVAAGESTEDVSANPDAEG